MHSRMKLVLFMICVILKGSAKYPPSMYTPSGYIGCFYSYPGFLNTIHYQRLSPSFNNTGNECKKRCKAAGFRYAGTVARLNCFCGNKIHQLKNASECNNKCLGNDKEYCGGDWHISLYDTLEPTSNKWITPGAGRPVYFVRNTKMDYENCVAFCTLLKPSSEVAEIDKNAELWLENNDLLEASENYWVYKSMLRQGECYYLAGTSRPVVIYCQGNMQTCKQETFKSRVLKASSCSLKYNCVCKRRV